MCLDSSVAHDVYPHVYNCTQNYSNNQLYHSRPLSVHILAHVTTVAQLQPIEAYQTYEAEGQQNRRIGQFYYQTLIIDTSAWMMNVGTSNKTV